MSKNSIIQISIVIVIILSSAFVYQKFFKIRTYVENTDKKEVTQDDRINTSSNINDKTLNIIDNLEYRSFDSLGNEYIIKAEKAENTLDNIEILNLTNVEGLIFLTNKPPIIINSKFATHNKENFNTKFFQNVRVNHDNLKIESDNLDLIYDKNLVNLYNIFKINFDDNILKADKIIFDMLTKDVSINMYDDEEKINLFYKVNNGNN